MTQCPSKINGKSLLYVWHNLLLFFVQKIDANKLNSSILGVFKALSQIYKELFAKITAYAAQKVKFSIKDFFCKCGQICSLLRIWPHLLKKSLFENFILCSVIGGTNFFTKMQCWVNLIQRTVSSKYQLNLEGTIYRIQRRI